MVGAGIVGACTAIELLRDGHTVTLIEPAPPGGEQAASYGNGGWISPASIIPMSLPGLWRRVPGFLRDPLEPLAIRPAYLPHMLPWLARFVAAGRSVRRVARTARALRALLADAPQRHMALAAEVGISGLVIRRGLLYVYRDRAAFDAEALAWGLRRDNGITWQELDADALRQQEPALDRGYQFGAFVPEGAHIADPGLYVAALVAHALTQGAERVASGAMGFRTDAGRLRAVRCQGGEIECERAVIAAGAWSRRLARGLGERIPLESERGYHAQIEAPEITPRVPVMPGDGKMAITPMRGGLRIAGQVELAGLDAAPDWRRAAILRDFARRVLPGLPEIVPEARVRVWMGHRPSTPDGLPVIGPARRCADVVYAFGHGHVGLASGPMTGRLVADLISGHRPAIDPVPYRAARF